MFGGEVPFSEIEVPFSEQKKHRGTVFGDFVLNYKVI